MILAEFNISADSKVLAFKNPAWNILADLKILAFQNPQIKVLDRFQDFRFPKS